ncbi:MAG TPA: LLM class flavin-dependent oxidoreductase [Acidimicrobiia bacterium]|nr:LLM class flavin-dependent oxidoreductase [Acidimicrobiia bacterium]
MELGIQSRGSWEAVQQTALWVEENGLAAMAVPDHYLNRGGRSAPAHDQPTLLAALAVVTDRVDLVSLVSPVTFRHPAVYYKIGVTIDEISGGRFRLGLGAGWMDDEFAAFGIPYPPLTERMAMLQEAMAYLRAAITPGEAGFEGTYYRLEEFDPHPHPTNLRLVMGGEGKRLSRSIAVRYADEYNLTITDPDRYRRVRDQTREELVETGRGADALSWTSLGPGLAAEKESDYRRLLEHMAQVTGQTTERIEEVYRSRSIPHGSGSQAREMLAELAEAGCERYYLQVFGLGPTELETLVEAYQG